MKASFFNPNLEIPVDKHGNVQHDANYYCDKFVKNYIFSGKVIIDKLVRYDHRMQLDLNI